MLGGGLLVPSRKKQPLTAYTLVILIVVFVIINTTIQLGYPNLASRLWINLPGIFTPGIILANISHLEPIHLIMNMLALSMFGTMCESLMKKKSYFLLLVMSGISTSILIWLFGSGPTLGFSGVNMGILTRYILAHGRHNPYDQGLTTMLIINLGIGLLPGISFWGHMGGAIGGALWWYREQHNRIR